MIILMKRKIDLLKAMRTFLVVVEEQSFSAAALKLNLVNSAVSRQVSDLETYFDCQLLYRTTRSMSLTAEGHYYLEQFQQVIGQLDSLESHAQRQQDRIAGHLRVTAPENSGRLGIQHSISGFLKTYTEVKLSWLLVNRYVNLVEEGIDLAIRVGELEDSGFIARHYMDLNIMFVASPEYLKSHGEPSHPKELVQHDCIIDSSNSQPGKWAYLEAGKLRQVAVTSNVDINSGELVADFAATGHGVAFLPDFLIQSHLDSGKLVPILEDFKIKPVPVSLVYPANRIVNPALKKLVQYLLDNKP